jgi:hypothetical protein
MTEKATLDEKMIVERILQRRHLKQLRIPAPRMQAFKEKLGEEIERTGKLTQAYVDQLLKQLKNGEL